MKKSKRNICILFGVFFCLFFCLSTGKGLELKPHQERNVSFANDGKVTISGEVHHSLTMEFRKGESMAEENFSVKENASASLHSLRQAVSLLLSLALIFLIFKELKAGLFAYLKFRFILPRYPGHIIKVLHRKDGKKKVLLFSE